MSRLLYMSLVIRPAITGEHAERDECVLVIDGFPDSVECVSDWRHKKPRNPCSGTEKGEFDLNCFVGSGRCRDPGAIGGPTPNGRDMRR
jgi:hypothetical protein